ncbi:copper homeostasis protein cutC homolog [Rhagoletis pomonella]|uniref:copper homeostasis protein cutC homolog n=1 Tax=Rhagoletis pomonella TaxID=28610 RepID=UPI00177EDA94|nr:copper homeostasis protein cutC homolog [Rhagoletis pomonella]XP_036328508.1 copper homeostasis protein cutC homolog [Rhagoletis pomonella]
MSTHDIKLEVCVDSIGSALAAAEGGAARIELCSALTEGGLTPSPGSLKTIKKLISIPIYCMLRPRRGNDFTYSNSEMEVVLLDLELLRANGADGFVFGALTDQRTIDVEKCHRVIERAAGMPVTFHRAFDLTNPQLMHETVTIIKELGFKRLLSSGFRATAIEGSENLAQLIAKHRDIVIMPGAGISVSNLDELLTVTKCIEFHASAQSVAGAPSSNGGVARMDCDVTMGKQDIEPYTTTDVHVVRQMVSIAMAAK